jgi:hypothetical protein
MTFAETQTLIHAIQQIETWTRAYEREGNKENPDWDKLVEYTKWLKEAKEQVFDIANK